MKCEDGEIPFLMSQVIQNQSVLDHPSLTQLKPIPTVERCPDLELIVQTRCDTDPELPLTSLHVLSATAKNASELERSLSVSRKLWSRINPN